MRRSQRRKDKEEESDDDGIHSDSDDDVRSKEKQCKKSFDGNKIPRESDERELLEPGNANASAEREQERSCGV